MSLDRSKVLIIGLMGKAGSGKDTVADYLVERFGFIKLAFADSLKEQIGKNLFGFSDDQLYGGSKEITDNRYGISPRKVLQLAGIAIRGIYSDLWVDLLMKKVVAHSEANRGLGRNRFVISDVRFKNEVECIKSAGGTLWVIERDGAGAINGVENHISEREALNSCKPDYVIKNNGSRSDLFSVVDFSFADVAVNHPGLKPQSCCKTCQVDQTQPPLVRNNHHNEMISDQVKADLIVCAIEGGSNYWYLFEKEATEQVSKYKGEKHPQNEYGCFSEAVFVAIDRGETIPIHDVDTGELLGKINKDSLNKAINLLHDQYPPIYANLLTGDYDANDADIFFQLAVTGKAVFG